MTNTYLKYRSNRPITRRLAHGLLVFVVLVATIKSATVNVAPGDDALRTAVTASTSDDVLKLEAGSYAEKTAG